MASAISINNVTKKFKLHKQQTKSIKERFILAGRNPSVDFLALDDVSIEVPAGTTVGLLGHNGSGKSTLLKCISGTMRPTSGTIEVRGRMAALLELGAGFHPELTGRENVYLNGSILGFSRVEIDAIFDDIVEFAELEAFIDNQVKHYSSGMYARLGFAVSVNVDPEILLIDEVLSVGDEAFQRKCLDRIATFQKEGRTILVVTHAADLVRQICDEVAVLDSGKLVAMGEPGDAVRTYRDTLADRGQAPPAELLQGPHATRGGVSLSEVTFTGLDPARAVRTGEPLVVEVRVDTEGLVDDLVVALTFHDQHGVFVHGTNTDVLGIDVPTGQGAQVVRFDIDRVDLLDGTYAVSLGAHTADGTTLYDQLDQVERFHVKSGSRAAGIAALPIRVSSHPA
ncbi:MAG: ABC transporter ATP-binding protein [Acidimicrobiales bacterium]